MKPLLTTVAMALVAVVTAAIAVAWIPRNEIAVTNNQVGQPLLGEGAEWDTGDVYRIVVERFDRELNSPRRMELVREGGTWVIAGKDHFPASNAARIAAVVSALRGKEILEVPSDEQDDHEEFGVVQLSEAGSVPIGVGTLLALDDARGNPLAQVVVGKSPPDDPTRRYVRLSGQPAIYLIEFDEALLSTEFPAWVDGDLLRLTGLQVPLASLFESIEINSYFIDPGKIDDPAARTDVYRARIRPEGTGNSVRWVYDAWSANGEGELAAEPQIQGAAVNTDTLNRLIAEFANFRLRDVARKSPNAAQALAEPSPSSPAQNFDWLKTPGFRHTGFGNGQHRFESLAGNVQLRFRNGNVDTIGIGHLAGLDMQNRTSINRYLLITCEVDEALVPEPQSPAGGNDETETAGDPAAGDEAGEPNEAGQQDQPDDETARELQRQRNERNQLLDSARTRAAALNQVHADWLYVISQESVNQLIPPLESLAVPGGSP